MIRWVLFIFLICFFQSPIFSQTLHALISVDSNDESIGRSVKKDGALMRDLVKKIASETGMTLKLTYYEGKQFTLKNNNNAINNLKPSANDMVFVYFSAHGYRTQKTKTKWPLVYHAESDDGLDLNKVYQTIASKKPRFQIVMADVCNELIEMDEDSPHVAPRSTNSNESVNYKALFLNSKGGIISSSSKPEQLSYALEKGGAFTLNFLAALKTATRSTSLPKWTNIMNTATKVIGKGTDARQDPQYQAFNLVDGGTSSVAVSTTTSNIPSPPPSPTNSSSNKNSFKFKEGKLVQKSAKKWILTWEGVDYNLKQYEKEDDMIYLESPEDESYYCLSIEQRMLWIYDDNSEDWEILVDPLK
ncbi:caspase family protein [Leptospira sp. GIMC2001]|uniref:caspase family protein n=1 Tax=Leptospira sp. GIMC2001 TaxID=1513297 RepID=UPI00234913D3|nr:caspase family protein [Leptospira sp. GIMC2001]WCL49280.1 caspase family protein [Leptospira sp. GIMC2001]